MRRIRSGALEPLLSGVLIGLDRAPNQSLLLIPQIYRGLSPPSIILAILLFYQLIVALRRRLSGWSLIHPLLTGALLLLTLISGPAAYKGFYWLIAYYLPLCLLAWAEWLAREGRKCALIPLVSLSFALTGVPLLYSSILGLAKAAAPSRLAIAVSALGLVSIAAVTLDSVLLMKGPVQIWGYVRQTPGE